MKKNNDIIKKKTVFQPALTPEAKERQLEALAVDLAEQKLRDGTASSQIIALYLKRSSTKERLEEELLRKQVELAQAKAEALQSSKRIEELYENALKAMKEYSWENDDEL